MMTDPKAVEAARRILKELPIDAADAQKVARALLAGEDNSVAAGAALLEPKHSPAPWKYDWRHENDETHCGVYFESFDGQAYAVARCPRYQTKERWEADARLIVSAPGMAQTLCALAADPVVPAWIRTLSQAALSEVAVAGEKAGITQAARSDARPSSSPSPAVRDALDHLHAMAPGIRDLDALDAVEKDDESMRSAVRDVREALEWYGEQARLARLIHSEGDAGRHALAEDGGRRARAALSPSPQADK